MKALHCILTLIFVLTLETTAQSAQLFADLGDFRLISGEIIKDCKIGYRVFGKLSEDNSNVILFPTWFGGKSESLMNHVGPGKLADSTKFYVITVDALGNGISSSPSNSAEQAGDKFPDITIPDIVNSQYRLLTEVLGLKKIYGMIGGSMGGMQVMQWIVTYPDFIERAIAYVGTPFLTSYDKLLWQTELNIIELAKKCDSSEKELIKAIAGLQTYALQTPAYRISKTGPEEFNEFINTTYENYAKIFNADDWASQLKAMMNHDITKSFNSSLEETASAVKAKVFIIVGTKDHMVNPTPSIEFANLLNAPLYKFENDCGHLAPGCEMEKFVEIVNNFFNTN